MVMIKVNSAGEIKLTKEQQNHIKSVSALLLLNKERWREFRRSAKSSGMKYFRLQSRYPYDRSDWWICDEHKSMHGMAFHISELFHCRCCEAEWMWFDEDVEKARVEVEKRKSELRRTANH